MPIHRPRPKIELLLLMLAGAVAGLVHFDFFPVGSFSDDAHYIVLAQSLVTGQGFRLINFPNAPVEWAFPPGWPLLLTPITAMFPGNYEALKLFSFALWLASIPLIYLLFRKRLASPYLEITIAIVVINRGIVGISTMVMSEASFLFFSLLTLNLFEWWEARRGRLHNLAYWLVLFAFTATAVYAQMIRTVGLSLVLTLVAYLMLSRRWREALATCGLTALLLLPQFWFNSAHGGSLISPGYENQVLNSSLFTKVEQVLTNLQYYTGGMITHLLIPILGPTVTTSFQSLGLGIVPLLFNWLILALIAIGLILSLRDFRLGVLYVAFYFLGILAFWNPQVGSAQTRFLIPIAPFLALFLMRGIVWSVRRAATGNERRVLVVTAQVAALIFLVVVMRHVQEWRNPMSERIPDLSAGSAWIAQHAPPQAVVMTKDPVPRYLYMRRQSVKYPAPDEDIEQYLRVNGVDYVLVSPRLLMEGSAQSVDAVERELLVLLRSDPATFEIVYRDQANQVAVYAVHDQYSAGLDPN
jgi:hypothetical protein